MFGFPPSQGEEPDPVMVKVEFSSHEPVTPAPSDRERPPENLGSARRVGSSQEEDVSPEGVVERRQGSRGKRPSGGSRIDSKSVSLVQGTEELVGATSESYQLGMVEAIPDGPFPTAVERLDRRLKSGFSRRREHRGDAEAEAPTNHATKDLREVVGSLEAGVVVELGVMGQTYIAPMIDQGLFNERCGGPLGRQGHRKPAVVRDPRQHVDERTVLNLELDNQVEAVELDPTRREAWEIPTTGRGGPSLSPATVERAVALENPIDRSDAGRRHALDREFATDGVPSVLAQGARHAKLSTYAQDRALDPTRRAIRRCARPVRPIPPVDTIEPPPARTIDSEQDRRMNHPEATSHRPDGLTPTHGRHHQLANGAAVRFLGTDGSPNVDFHGDATGRRLLAPEWSTVADRWPMRGRSPLRSSP